MTTKAALSRIHQSTFIRHNAIFFIGSLMVGVLNYLYYPVLGRLLEPAAFGEVQTLVSLFLQIGIFLNVLGLLSINIIANADHTLQRNRVILELEKLAFLVSILLLAVTVLLSPWLQGYFNFGSPVPFILLASVIVVTVPFTFRSAYLRGKQLFGYNSWAFIVGAGTKLLLSAALVAIGFHTSGAILGILLSQLLAFWYASQYARKHGFTERLRGQLTRLPDMTLIRPELPYALFVLASSLSVTVLYSVDIIMVKHYFDAETAGLYAGIATIARILFFLTASITQVLMPSIKLHLSEKENRRTFIKSLVLLMTIGGGALLVFLIIPKVIISVLMGANYLTYADLLPRLSLAIFVISVLNLAMTYFIALRRYTAGFIIAAGTAITWVLMYTSHQSLTAVVNSLLYGSIVALTMLVAWSLSRRSVLAKGG